MTAEEAIKNIVAYGYFVDDIPAQVAKALDTALAALRAQKKQENPKSLTLDKLREMDGVPVWVECLFNKDLSSYAIIERGKNGIFTRLFFACFDYYEDEWLAYHHRPKEALI